MDLNYLIVRNDNEKMLKKLLHLLKKILKFCSIECYWKKYWKVLKISTYWTLLKKYWKILILIEPSIEKVLIIEHYWKINNTFSLLYWIVLYCIVLYWTQTQMLNWIRNVNPVIFHFNRNPKNHHPFINKLKLHIKVVIYILTKFSFS